MGYEDQTKRNMLAMHAYPAQFASDFSDVIKVTAATDTVAPLAPGSFALTAVAEGILLEWERPSHNWDGSPCTDLAWFRVYRRDGAEVPEDLSVYDQTWLVSAESHRDRTATDTGETYHYRVVAVDFSGNASAPTGNESGSPSSPTAAAPVVPDDASGQIFNDAVGGDGVVSGYACLGLAFKNPPTDGTAVRIARIKLEYQYTTDGGLNWRDADGTIGQWSELFPEGFVGYMHKYEAVSSTPAVALDHTGARAYRYRAYWVGEDGTVSTTPDTAGGVSTTADASDNDGLAIHSMFAHNLVVTGEVKAEHVDVVSLAAISADLGAVTAGSIVVGSTNKIWLNDGGDGRLEIGGSVKNSAPFMVTASGKLYATNVELTGVITAGSGSDVDWSFITNVQIVNADIDSVAYSKITAGTSNAAITVGSSGHITSSNYVYHSTGFKIWGNGDAEFNDVYIRGNLQAQAGSSIHWDYITDVAMSVGDIEVDGDLDFQDGAVFHKITGLDAIYFQGASGAPRITSGASSIVIESGDATLDLGSTAGYAELEADDNITLNAGDNIVLSPGSGTTEGVIGTWKYSGAQVYNSTSPTSATLLRLASYVGSRRVMVMLRVYQTSSLSTSYAFADTSGYLPPLNAASYPGASQCKIDQYDYNIVMVMTNASGQLYWKAGNAVNCDVWLLGWWG